ncbi:hypothetical protein [Paracoccus sp. SM22M-07]|uniref:hypothetical protein n=1 Tax=Paracoccus sp. SM22M-07 TaxID=1520813 RepID=UPI0009104D03|nr:hypothetical protein [Paracoccus sp. SM22M-07]OJH45167.1 hypothetical protein IE00_05745 [Paracoccus sp. SM22M-07]
MDAAILAAVTLAHAVLAICTILTARAFMKGGSYVGFCMSAGVMARGVSWTDKANAPAILIFFGFAGSAAGYAFFWWLGGSGYHSDDGWMTWRGQLGAVSGIAGLLLGIRICSICRQGFEGA